MSAKDILSTTNGVDQMEVCYLDASCLVKLVLWEQGSEAIRSHLHKAICATTTFCFYEALGVLKSKWVKRNRPDSIDQNTYLSACQELCALVADENIQMEIGTLINRELFADAERITEAHAIDLSDSFQLVSLKKGMMARLATTIEPVLVTEDKGLQKAAKAEGLKVLGVDDLPST